MHSDIDRIKMQPKYGTYKIQLRNFLLQHQYQLQLPSSVDLLY